MTTTAAPRFAEIERAKLKPSKHNPRRTPDAQALKELAESIKSLGVLEPLVVRPTKLKKGDGYEILAGHRRHAAAKAAGVKILPCMIHELDDRTAIEVTVTENLQREDLHPLEEADGLVMLEEAGWSVEEMAAQLGKSPRWVARRKCLSNLSAKWRKAANDPKRAVKDWPAAALEELARVPVETQDRLFDDRQAWLTYRRGSAEDMRHQLVNYVSTLDRAPFDVDDETLNPKQGACVDCDLRASKRPALFDDLNVVTAAEGKIPKGDVCLSRPCFEIKLQTHVDRQAEKAREKYGKDLLVGTREHNPPKGHVNVYGLTLCKKADKGAKPILDPDSGRVKWMRSYSAGGSSSAAKKTGPKTLKERREGLECRRRAEVITRVIANLRDPELPGTPYRGEPGDLTIDPCGLLVVFGSSSNFQGGQWSVFGHGVESTEAMAAGNLPGRSKSVDGWELAKTLAEAGAEEEFLQRAWLMVRDVLISRMNYRVKTDLLNGKQYDEARHCTELLNLDFKELRACVDIDIPEPKAWANLNADGTPKTTKAAAKKPAKKKSPARKNKGKSPGKRKAARRK